MGSSGSDFTRWKGKEKGKKKKKRKQRATNDIKMQRVERVRDCALAETFLSSEVTYAWMSVMKDC